MQTLRSEKMNSKQRRKVQRFSINLIVKLGGLFKEHVEQWARDPNVTKEQIIKELKIVVKESGLLR